MMLKKLLILLYSALLEPLLAKQKQYIAQQIIDEGGGLSLDVCCGIGRQCQMLAPFCTVIGLDLDFTMLKYAHTNAPTVPFVCADAAHLPFKSRVFKHAVVSLALHDKNPSMRSRMLNELSAVGDQQASLVIMDFARPLSCKSKVGHTLIWLIERLAGNDHFTNGREFVKNGGLTTFLSSHSLTIETIKYSAWDNISIIRALFSHAKVTSQHFL